MPTVRKPCCGERPQAFTREGADHHGLDVGLRCRHCGHEVYIETSDPGRADREPLYRAWNKSDRKQAIDWPL